MKVKLLVSRAGPNLSQNAGEVVEVSERDGIAMIAAGQAEVIGTIERATSKKPTQKAVKGK